MELIECDGGNVPVLRKEYIYIYIYIYSVVKLGTKLLKDL